jgi:tetratricopeptide (TPR) repeat protein
LRGLLLLAVLAAFGGCATGPEHRALLGAGAPVELTEVPFFPQEAYQCGPAALATVLVAAGVPTEPDALAPQVYVPERRGSLQAELLAATRRHGRVPYLLPGHISPLLEEVRAGRPVLVFQNLGLERWPVWHYAVLVGFDPARGTVLLRSGTERRMRVRARPFLASWDRAGRWSLVAADPARPPAGADVLGWLQAAAPFESTGAIDTAATAYEAAVARWPGEPAAWTALGNARYHQQRLQEAAGAYRQALELDPAHWVARNNLIQALIDLGCPAPAKAWAKRAGQVPASMAEAWTETLARLAAAASEACSLPDG